MTKHLYCPFCLILQIPILLNYEAEGLVPVKRVGLDVVAGQSCDVGKILLSEGKPIAGCVFAGEKGLPVAGAEVRVSGSGIYPKSCHTNDAGRYRFLGLADGLYDISVWREGYAFLVRSNVSAAVKG
jgi:hypothetical protein